MQLKVEFDVVRGKHYNGNELEDIDKKAENCTALVDQINKFIDMTFPELVHAQEPYAIVQSSYGSYDGYDIVPDNSNINRYIANWINYVYDDIHDHLMEPDEPEKVNGVTVDVIVTYEDYSDSFIIDVADINGRSTPCHSISIVHKGTSISFSDEEETE